MKGITFSFLLNLENLFQTTENDIEELLSSFWKELAKFHAKPEAFERLGLTGTEPYEEQKQTAKRLLQKHHPDKGGNIETFRDIQNAWEQIKK